MAEKNDKSIYQRILAVMEDVKRVEKKETNLEQKYKYASESDITEMIRPLLVKHGLVLLMTKNGETRWRSRGEGKSQIAGITMTFTLVNVDKPEDRITYEMSGEGMDGGDKNEYKAFTGCVKYALAKPFLVSTGDDAEEAEKKDRLRALEKDFREKAGLDAGKKTGKKGEAEIRADAEAAFEKMWEGESFREKLTAMKSHPDMPLSIAQAIKAELKDNPSEEALEVFYGLMLKQAVTFKDKKTFKEILKERKEGEL